MPVDDVGSVHIQAEFFQNPVHHIFPVHQAVIAVLFFRMGAFILNKVPLESGHLVLAEHGRVRPCPDIPDDILSLLRILLILGVISFSRIMLQDII